MSNKLCGICIVFVLVLLLVLLLLFSACSSMTPRYAMFDGSEEPPNNSSSLLQIPRGIYIDSIDGKEPSTGVHSWLMSQAMVQHIYRETLMPQGVRRICFRLGMYMERLNHNTSVTYTQKAPFVTVFNAESGRSYRVLAFLNRRDKEVYGWVEMAPVLIKQRNVKPGINFFRNEYQEWNKYKWCKITGAVSGNLINLDSSELIKLSKADLVKLHKKLLRYKITNTPLCKP